MIIILIMVRYEARGIGSSYLFRIDDDNIIGKCDDLFILNKTN